MRAPTFLLMRRGPSRPRPALPSRVQMQVWEGAYLQRLDERRVRELASHRRYRAYTVVNTALGRTSPMFGSAVTFLVLSAYSELSLEGCARARSPARARALSLSEASARARRGCRYWVPAHTVNFKFIPGEQRLLYINVMQIMCATSARDARVGAPAP